MWISCPEVGSLGDNVRSNRRARPRFSFVSKCCSSPSREWYLFTWCLLTSLENGRARTIPVYLCASFFGVEFPGHWCCACTTGLQMPAYFPKWLCQFPLPPLMSDSLFVPWSTNKGNWTSIAYIKPAEGVSTGENSQRWHEYKWVGLLLSRSLSEAARNKLTWPEVRLWDRKSHILVWRFSRITIEEARVSLFIWSEAPTQ